MINSSERHRVFYWLDRSYEPTQMATFESCVIELQQRFPNIMRFKLEIYINEYLGENDGVQSRPEGSR